MSRPPTSPLVLALGGAAFGACIGFSGRLEDGMTTQALDDNGPSYHSDASGVIVPPPDDGNIVPPPPPPPAPRLAVVGRFAALDANDPTQIYIGQPSVSVGARFSGTGLTLTMANRLAGKRAYFDLTIDGGDLATMSVQGTQAAPYILAQDLPAGEHTLWLTRRNEPIYSGGVTVSGVAVADGNLLAPPAVPARRIEVLGASIEQGWCLDPGPASTRTDANQDACLGWAQIAAEKLGAAVINTAISGAGMRWDIRGTPACTLPRLWLRVDLSVPTPVWDPGDLPVQVAIINLVGNDWTGVGTNPASGLAGLRDPTRQSQWQETALGFIDTLAGAYPAVRIYLMIHSGWSDSDRAVLQTLFADTVAKAAARGATQVAVIDHPHDDGGSANCYGHPIQAAHNAMGATTAARLRRDLGW